MCNSTIGSFVLSRAHVNVNHPGSARISFVVFNGFLAVLVTYHIVFV